MRRSSALSTLARSTSSLSRALLAFGFTCTLLLGGLALSPAAEAQEWATKMFKDTSHNFGALARDSKQHFNFQFSNPYKETVHIASATSSSTFVSVDVPKASVETYGSASIIARVNTHDSTGANSATITVTIDQPYSATVELKVDADIRGEILVQGDSGVIDFGTVDQGDVRHRKITIMRYNLPNWTITDVRSADSDYDVSVVNGRQSGGWKMYDVDVAIKKEAKPGKLEAPLVIVTNDSQTPQFPIEVEGEVVSH